MPKRGIDGVPESFKIHVERAKLERQSRQRLANVEVDDALDHYIWNGLDTVKYKVILGVCAYNEKIVPKKEYALVIAGYPSWVQYQKHYL